MSIGDMCPKRTIKTSKGSILAFCLRLTVQEERVPYSKKLEGCTDGQNQETGHINIERHKLSRIVSFLSQDILRREIADDIYSS